jgi:formylglycine-generating enzyme
MTNCGPCGESCCTSLEVTGGSYYRTYDVNQFDGGWTLMAEGGPTGEADPATVSSFRLDKFEVTVGRFRQFVNAWNGGTGWTPPAGSGKHAYLNAGQGLANTGSPGTYETGWLASDNSNVAPTDSNLACQSGWATWTASPGSQENLPVNCVNWWESYAFCIWDGGFLPSEAEWEYAAAGGSQQREFPWGSTPPGTGNQYAIYGNFIPGENTLDTCYYPSGGTCAGVANIAPVGTAPLAAGRWGQLDLAGNVFERNLDWYADYADPCADCAYLTAASYRVGVGGGFWSDTVSLLPPTRDKSAPTYRANNVGFRCARAP